MADVDPRLEFVGNAKPTTLIGGGLSLTGTSFQVADATNYPTGAVGDFPIVINRTGSTAEKVLCSVQSGGVFTVIQRGYDGTIPATHDPNETVEVCWPATEADLSNSHRASTFGVHGVAGNVVGDTDTQTLSNKTISGAGNTFSNIPQTAITGLSTSLAAKLDVPATAIAKGSLLAGTGANVADSLAVGTDGTVLTADSSADAGVSWQASSAVALLAAAASSASVTLPASTAALDTTNLKLTFTAPSSGKVLLRASASLNNGGTSGSWTFGWYTHGTTTVVGSAQALLTYSGISGASLLGCYTSEQIVTGLTAGTSYTLDLTGLRGGVVVSASDFVLTAWAA